MRKLCGMLSWTLPVALILTVAGFAAGQEADADRAQALLNQGIRQFDSLQFEAAKATLLKVDADALDDADADKLNRYLQRVRTAITQQRQARQALRDAREALDAGNYDAAIAGFQQAAASEYLPEAQRRDAKAHLAEAQRKAERAAEIAATVDPDAAEATGDDEAAVEPDEMTADEGADGADEPTADEGADGADEMTADEAADEAAGDDEPDTAETDAGDSEALRYLVAHRSREAAKLVNQAKEALAENRVDAAIDLLEQALALQPDNAKAKELYEFARRTGQAGPRSGALSDYEIEVRIARQIAEVEIAARLRQSRKELDDAASEKDFDEAMKLANSAKAVLENNENVFPPKTYRSELTSINQYIERIKTRRQQWQQAKEERTRREAAEQERQRRLREQRERQRKIDDYERDIRVLREKWDFERALEVTEQLLALDPQNDWARDQRDILEQFVIMEDRKMSERAQEVEEAKLLAEIEWKMVPWHKYINFPRTWAEIRKRAEIYGAVASGETEEDLRARQKLDRNIDLIDFNAAKFGDVVGFLRDVSDANIWVNWRALQFQNVTRDTLVTAKLADISVRRALEVVLADAGGDQPLQYVIEGGIVKISTGEDLRRKKTTRVYDINHLLYHVRDFDGPTFDFGDLGDEDDDDDDDGGDLGFPGDDDDDDQDDDDEKSKQQIINELTEMIRETIAPGSWDLDASIEEHHGKLIVTQTAENHQALAKLLNQLGESTGMQVAIEARFISVATGFLNAIGIDFDVYFNLGSTLGGGAPNTVEDPWTGATVPAIGQSGWMQATHNVPGGTSFPPMGAVTGGGSRTTGFGNIFGVSTGAVAAPIGGQVGNPGLEIAGVFLDDIQVDFLLQATQAHRATRTLTAPRVTIWNGQRAYVTVATHQAYVSGYEFPDDIDIAGEDADVVLTALPVVSTVPTGTTLDVQATVTGDRKYVIMTVRPQVTTLSDISTQQTPFGPVDLPIVAVQELRTTVMVPDRGTLLLGGQTLAGEVEQELGVPMVSKIPILNRLYTNRGKVRDQQTLLILIRPEIIIPEEHEKKAHPE